jgi:hypothetical protein
MSTYGTVAARSDAAGSSRPPRRWPRPWLALSIAAAGLAAGASAIGLVAVDRVYGNAYPVLTDQAIAQDLANLVIVSPVMIILAVGARRGSLRAHLALLGALAFTVYSYVIYTFSIEFGPLFLVWVAVLGLSMYALIGAVAALDPPEVRRRYGRTNVSVAASFLVVIGALFAMLWLGDIVPALAGGTSPAAAVGIGVPTNPVHVLDLAIFLPAVVFTGIWLLRGRDLGYVLAPGLLLFLSFTGVPILITPFVATARGNDAAWWLMAPIGLVTAIGVWLAATLLRGVDTGSTR